MCIFSIRSSFGLHEIHECYKILINLLHIKHHNEFNTKKRENEKKQCSAHQPLSFKNHSRLENFPIKESNCRRSSIN